MEDEGVRYSFEVVDVPQTPAVFVAAACDHERIGETLMRVLPAALDHAVKHGVQPAGPPFARYLCWRERECELEGGLPLSSDLAGSGSVLGGVLGGCKAAHTVHIGHYSGLKGAHRAAMEWIDRHGYVVAGAPWESYATDPAETPDPSQWRTDVFWPIA